MLTFKGIGASSGISIANIYKLETPEFEIQTGTIENPEQEVARLHAAIEISIAQIETIKETRGIDNPGAYAFALGMLGVEVSEETVLKMIENLTRKAN